MAVKDRTGQDRAGQSKANHPSVPEGDRNTVLRQDSVPNALPDRAYLEFEKTFQEFDLIHSDSVSVFPFSYETFSCL